MILRSQLRMNKNIVFPFVSCIMIMFTLLVLIHKSADELNTVKKELNLCKQQHESVYTQLQSAIEYKERLEKSLENEKTDEKKQIEKMQNDLKEEKENHKKEKEEDDNHLEELNKQYNLLQNENKEMKENNEKFRKKIIDIEDEKTKLNEQLKATRIEKEQLLTNKDKTIEDLQEKLKNIENQLINNKVTPEVRLSPLLDKMDIRPNFSKGSTTPPINPQAIVGHEELPKQVGPPPNNDQGNMNKEMLSALNMRSGDEPKPDENVINAPQIKTDDEKYRENTFNAGAEPYDKKNNVDLQENADQNMGNKFLPIPYNFDLIKKQANSASNNAAERANLPEDQQGALPPPVPNIPNEKDEKVEEILKLHNEDENDLGEDDGPDDDFDDKNDVHIPGGKKSG